MTSRIGLFVIAMVSGCLPPQYCEGEAAPAESAPPRPTARTVAQVLPTESKAVDILFVIDDSRSMTDEQAQLGIWSSKMFEVLAGTGELPDVHVAVTSSSVAIVGGSTGCASGTGGSFFVGSAVLKDKRFIRDVAGVSGREKNYSGTLTDTFAKMAKVGAGGCGFEQPFKAARMALSNKTEGFLRDDALLLVVFVTDEDDCSATDSMLFDDQPADACSELGTNTSYRCFEHGVRCYDGLGSRAFGARKNCQPDESGRYVETIADFSAFLKKVKSNPAQVVVAGIYGKPNHIEAIRDERITQYETPRLADVCGGGGKEGTGATPAVRMNALLAEFGGRASQSSICESELSWAMRDVGLVTYGAATRNRCLRGAVLDTDLTVTGVQPTCRVEAVVGSQRLEVPVCNTSVSRDEDRRCFMIESDATCTQQLAVRVYGGAANETMVVACDVDEQ